jgi:RNA polymerase sigma-70 factor (ECF subfamily)
MTMTPSRDVKVEDFESAALPYINELYRTAARLSGSRTEAQDLVQNVYLLAWKSFHRFEPGTNCRAWLFKILLNEIRHHQRRTNNSRLTADNGMLNDAAFEEPVSEVLTDEDVLAALDALPVEFREVVLLADVEDFPYKQIAEILGIPIGTVMSRLSRGRKQLRMKLKGMSRDAIRKQIL